MRNIVVRVCLIMMLVVGAALLMLAQFQHILVGKMSEQLISQRSEAAVIDEQHALADDATDQLEANKLENEFDFDVVQSLSIWDVLSAQFNIEDIPVKGSIHIPSVQLALPIINGVGKQALATGAGTMKADQRLGEGNYALASHYIEGKDILFGPLYRLQIGDSIYVTDTQYLYEYETTAIEVIEATDVYVIDDVPGEVLLTLITCAEKGTKRLLVQAKLVTKELLEVEKHSNLL